MSEKAKDLIPWIGTATSLTLGQLNLILGVVAGTLTVVYTSLKIYDWVEEKRLGKKGEK